MQDIELILDNHIRIPAADVPVEIRAAMEEAATIPNPEKIAALDRGLAGARDLDDTVEFWDYQAEHLVLPRGYANQIQHGLKAFGFGVVWDDRRTVDPKIDFAPPIPCYPYQEKIVKAVLKGEQGIVVAPTGAGKTVAALEVIRRVGGNALVIVNTKEILQQWMDRVDQWLGESYPIDMVGDGVYTVGDGVTIAIQASLWSKAEELLADGFFKRFQVVCLDECHHATANTYRYVLNEFSACWRFGMSATPDKTGEFELAQAILGDILVEIDDDEVGDKTVKPSVEVIETSFYAEYKSWTTSNGLKRNNYSSVLKALAEDDDRNDLIAGEIVDRHPENANLVLSKRLNHLGNIEKALHSAGYPKDNIYWLTGKESREERKRVVELVEDGSCVVLSTLADEALDAPRLDRVHICFPTANGKLLIQQVGRIRRRHPDKSDAKILDYWDRQVGPFNKNYLNRRHEVYDPKGFKVYKRKDSE